MKLPFITPDVEQALEHFLKLTLLHNMYPIALVCVGLVFLVWSLYRPSRSKILAFVGCMLLFVEFEYSKHVVHGLLEQTRVTITTETPRYRFMWIMEKFITRGIPLILILSGGSTLLLSIVMGVRERGEKKKAGVFHPPD